MKDMTQQPAPPVAPKHPRVLSKHGDERIDPYYWLNDRDNPEVIAYLEAENAYTQSRLAHTESLQEELYREIIGRIKQDDQSVPYFDNDYYYLTGYEQGQEYPIYARKKARLDAPEEILLNVNELAEPHPFYHVGGMSVSPDNTLLAYAEDTVSRRIYTIRFKHLVTGDPLTDVIPGCTGAAVWSADNRYIFYTLRDPTTLRGYQVMRHELGKPTETDVAVYEETDDTFFTYVYKTKSRKYIVIGAYANMSQDYRVLPADDPTGAFRLIQAREHGHEYSIAHYEDKFYILTNWDARNFRLMVTDENQTTKDHWREVIAHRPEVLVEDIDIFKDYLVLSERHNGITQLRIRPWEGEEHYIDFPEDAYLANTSVNLEFDTRQLRLNYQSMATPPTVYDYDMETRQMAQRKQLEVLGGFKPENYRTERLYATARDGVKVPVSIVYHKDYQKDGTAPLLLYGYGAYGHSMEPYFSSVRISLLDRGFAFAIAHVRGGEEMGRHWYEDGKLLQKKNTFYDFIDVGRYLLEMRYVAPDLLFAMGGSAGGLLVGAVVNMAPEMWRGIVAAVPFVDVLTTMLDDSIPLTTGEYDEWGNPNEKEYYEYIKSYSPYDNIEAKSYPAMLVSTGLHDSQVQYWEPAKWVARLRELKTDDRPLLLHTNLEAGHGGASGRFRRHKETALEYAFILDQSSGV